MMRPEVPMFVPRLTPALVLALGIGGAASQDPQQPLKSGVELTLKQLNSVFAKFSVSEINPMGERFDPHRHQAISAVESELEPNTVAQVLQKGYLLHERVIRPALVTVSKQKDQAVES